MSDTNERAWPVVRFPIRNEYGRVIVNAHGIDARELRARLAEESGHARAAPEDLRIRLSGRRCRDLGLACRVFLDGEEVRDCVFADERAGRVRISLRDEHGCILIGASGVKTRDLYGAVCITEVSESMRRALIAEEQKRERAARVEPLQRLARETPERAPPSPPDPLGAAIEATLEGATPAWSAASGACHWSEAGGTR